MISVCMATHNGEKYIKEQVDSILNQLSEKDELIISDDSSNDKTIDILKSYKDDRIKIFSHSSTSDLPSCEKVTLNFENALKHAQGDYIFLSDQDDVWCQNKISIIMKYLKEYDYVVSDAFVTDEKLNIISETRFIKGEKVHFNKYMALVFSTPYQGSCAAFKRCILDKALPFPKGLQSHDRWIGDVAAFYFKYAIIPDKLIIYRRHIGTVSNTFGRKKRKSIFKIFRYKLIYIKGIFQLLLSSI